ncbi:MAG: hypothetical protein J7M05_08245 [Anaerolineae bacterium]|nr:hypothetical protein [Anaerolineae bacterium]
MKPRILGGQSMQEDEAISRLKRGDISGLKFLVQAYQLKALCAAYLIVQDPQTAQDVVADDLGT